MKRVKTLALGAVVALSLIGASSASAANWDPQNTHLAATQQGISAFTFDGGDHFTCSTGDLKLSALGAAAEAVTPGPEGPVTFGGCTESVFFHAVTVTTFGTWRFTAASTTSVHLLATSTTGSVALIHYPDFACTVRVPSPLTIANNTWNNATHILTINSTASFPVHASTADCAAAVGTTARLDARYLFPNNVTIT
jgi:hypothetical protein